MSISLGRRDFLHAAAATAAFGALTHLGEIRGADAPAKRPKLKKAVKYDMIKIKGSPRDKFELVKRLGFLGVEINSPSDIDRKAAVEAQAETGIKIHGVIDSVHWNQPLSDPNPEVRAKGLAALTTALEDAHTYGADDVLLVPGVVRGGVTFEQCRDRSQAEIRKVLPLAEKYKVKIAIEVVWNNFITTPDQFVSYIDSFGSPYLGGYFDCSNMVKFGVKSGDWIRKLGKRMVKFDFKGFSKAKFAAKQNPWVPIGEGDEDWPDIVAALGEIGYDGWATAEVDGGGEKELRDVADRMNRCLGLI
jgi:L-ribulose-5-phosphate 3-epimerase